MNMFIVVVKGGKEREMQACMTLEKALVFIKLVGENPGDPRRVETVFSVDYKGQIDRYEIVLWTAGA